MQARARLLGHPIHQMLIVIPLGLFAGALVFDILNMLTASSKWADTSLWMIIVGIVGGGLAAVFGFTDWTGIPRGTRARSIGAVHGIGNVVVVLFFIVSALLRARVTPAVSTGGVIVAFLGAGLSLFTAWLGGELVNRMGIGVHEGANVNSSSSLSHRPATDTSPTAVALGRTRTSPPGRDIRADDATLPAPSDARAAAHPANQPPTLPGR